MKYKMVSVKKFGLYLCKWSMAIMVWLAIILQSQQILWLTAFLFLWSALLKIEKAPFILAYRYLYDWIFKSEEVMVDEYDLQFVHLIALGMNILVLIPIWIFGSGVWYSWILVAAFAILKSLSAYGYCPASKLRSCALDSKSSCCSFLKK